MADLSQLYQARPDPLAYGNAMLDGSGPFAMADAQAEAAASGQSPDQAEVEKQVLDKIKAKTDAIGNSNKIKEMALKLTEEMQKAQELEARMQEHPEVVDLVTQMLNEENEQESVPVEQPEGIQ